jgi:hypothetical protein
VDSTIGTLSVSGNTTFTAGGPFAPAAVLRTWVSAIAPAPTSSRLAVAGLGNDLNFVGVGGSNRIGLEVRNAGGIVLGQPYTFTLATAADQIQRNGLAVGGSYTFDSGEYTLTSPDFAAFTNVSLFTDPTGTELRLTFTPLPEPGAAVAVSAALGLLGAIRRRVTCPR